MNETKETNLIIEYINNERRTYDIKRQVNKLIEQAYNEGFKAGQEEALSVDSDKFIEQGRNEAWAAAKKVYFSVDNGGLLTEEVRKIFGIEWFSTILKEFSASEVVEKLHAYEEQKEKEEKEIKVGDEVYLLDENYHSVVISIYDNNGERKAEAISQNGKWVVDRLDNLHKTGRHFPEIVEVLKKMRDDKE